MMNSRLTVSVIVPTYNRAKLVGDAIDSLLAQTRVPDEIIVVDDGSIDDTQAVLQRYQSPVIVIKNQKAERSSARNTGLKYATGDLIAFLDDDDTLPPASIEQRAAALETKPDYDVVYGDVLMIDFQGNKISRFTEFKPGERPSGMIFSAFAYDNLSPIHAFMFRRTSIQDGGRFDESLETMEDYDFWLRMSAQHKFLYIDDIFAYYRIHDRMTTLNFPDRMRENHLKVQLRAVAMPAFQQMNPHEQARVYYAIGAKYLILGQIAEARSWLKKVLRLSPTYWKTYPLLALSLIGKRGISAIAHLRRKVRSSMQKRTRWVYNH